MQKGGRPGFDPRSLRIERQGDLFVLLDGADTVRTPGGHPVAGPSPRFPALVRREAEIARGFDPHGLSAYALFCAQKDHVEQGRDPIARDLPRLLAEEEPVLETGAGPEEAARRACWAFVDAFFAARGVGGGIGAGGREHAAVARDYAEATPTAYGQCSPPQRAGIALLFRTHHAGVLVPLMLVHGLCTASEYAEALLAMHRAHPRIYDPDWKAFTDNFVIAREDATIVEEYLRVAG